MSTQATIVQGAPHDGSEPISPPRIGGRTWVIGLTVLGVTAFTIALLASLPATLVAQSLKLRPDISVAGTVWDGDAALPNGDRLNWRADPLGSVLSLSLQSEVHVIGDLTNLTGRMSASAGTLTISNVSGVASWSLLRAAFPGIDFACDVRMRLDDATLVIGRNVAKLAGSASSSAGRCSPAGAAKPFEIPATHITATTKGETSLVRITLASDPAALLAEIATGAKGELTATVQPLALKLAPGATASGPVVYEMRAP